jgi:hypothetical protein
METIGSMAKKYPKGVQIIQPMPGRGSACELASYPGSSPLIIINSERVESITHGTLLKLLKISTRQQFCLVAGRASARRLTVGNHVFV